jgi:hypothetical protein
MKKSGRHFSMVAYVRIPPRASSMPQPPAVSPDHTNETLRRSLGAVRKRPICGALRREGNE